MASSWLPSRDTLLLPFAQNFSARITAAPLSYGLVAADATALAAAVTDYNAKLTTALTPATRTKTSIVAKDLSKAQLVAIIRSFAKRIQANPAVLATQKSDLGLPPGPAARVPVPPPSTQPTVNVVVQGVRSHVIRLADESDPTRRARPAGVQGAEVYSFVPATPEQTPPTDLEQWRFEGLATRAEFEIDYNATDVGKTGVIVARWYNSKGEAGPLSAPVSRMIAA